MKRIISVMLIIMLSMPFVQTVYAEPDEDPDNVSSEYDADENADDYDDMGEQDSVFYTGNGTIYISLPEDGDNWMEIYDPASWFAVTDGRDLITVDHLSDPDPDEEVEVEGEWFEEVYQTICYAGDDAFTVTGYVSDEDDADMIKDSVNSVQILEYEPDDEEDTEEDTEEDSPDYDIREIDVMGYCTEPDGVNVRSGPSTDDTVIGDCSYGEQLYVAGMVTEEGADTGWLCVDYDGENGYIWGDFFSPGDPDEEDDDLSDNPEISGDYPYPGNTQVRLENKGWYVAKLWVQIHYDNGGVLDYYTDSAAIEQSKELWFDFPDNAHAVTLILCFYDITGWDYDGPADYYDDLNDGTWLTGLYATSRGTTFKPKLKSVEQKFQHD